MRSRAPFLLLALFSASAAWAAEPFGIERSLQIRRIGPPTLSPDGRTAVAAVTGYSPADNSSNADLWLWSTDGKTQRQLTTQTGNESSPLVSPDGTLLAFVAQRDGDTASQLYLLPLAGGEARRLTRAPSGVAQPKWFADGRRIAFLSKVWPGLSSFEQQAARQKEREQAKVKALVTDTPPFSSWDTILDDRQLHLWSVGLDGGEPQAITLGTGLELPRNSGNLDSPLYDLAPDGKEVAFIADSDPKANVINNDVFVVVPGEAKARNLTADNPAADSVPLYSPDGRTLAFSRQQISGFYGDTRRLMLYDRAGGKLREVAAGWDRSKDNLTWARDSQSLIGSIDDAGTNRLYRIALDGTATALTGESSFGSFSLAKDGQTGIALRQSFTEPPTLVAIDLGTKSVRQVSTLNDELLAGTAWGKFESVTYPGAKGEPVQMWVNYPPGFDPAKKHPLLLLIHGGPHNGVTNAMQFRWNSQVFGSWGYVTAWPNFHGSSGFGQAFTDSINPQQDELPYEDVIKAAEWLRAKPWIDGGRMSAGGASYGGYLGAIVLGRPHPFQAMVIHAGVYDWFTQYSADYSFEPRRFGDFWDKPEVFAKGSPHFGAGNFQTPTLVSHGQLDMRVPVSHGIELYQTLQIQGVPTRFVYFPDENHWIQKPGNAVLWYGEVKRWLEKYGQGGAPQNRP